ncbi:MAG: hypothetical protein D6805_06455 [Planctomycetota bacterium]|nr:MAG: hypothetical protein D6805_06455 [Planctomycetota bacterium]
MDIAQNPNHYPELSQEEALSLLEQGKIIEERYIPKITLGISQPQEIAKTVKISHKIYIRNSCIGQLNFHACDFYEEIKFENVRFEGPVLLGNQRHNQGDHASEEVIPANNFADAVIFEQCHFQKMVDLTRSRFQSFVLLQECQFHGAVFIYKAEFAKHLSFLQSHFQKRFLLENSEIQSNLNLSKTHLHGSLCIEESKLGSLSMQSVIAEDKVSIVQVYIHAYWHLPNAKFVQNFFCKNLSLQEELEAKNSHFCEKNRWEKLRCQQRANFSKTLFEKATNFQDCWFGEELNMDNICAKSSFYLQATKVEGAFHLRGAEVYGAVSFKESRLHRDALLNETFFSKKAEFRFLEISGRASFSSVTFHQEANFYRAKFLGSTFFLGTRFQDVTFVNTTFGDQAFFSFDKNTLEERNRQNMSNKHEVPLMFVSTFEGKADFTNALFYQKTIFENIFFQEFVRFKNTYFAEEISFQNSCFSKGADFQGVYCAMELDFTNALFQDYVNFDSANINRRLNLTNAVIQQGISFYHAIIDVVVVEKHQIQNQLIYEGKVPGKEHFLNYTKCKDEYLILKESYQQRGKFLEDDWAYYRYRLNDRRSTTRKAWQSLFGRQIREAVVTPQTKEQEYDAALRDILKQVKKVEKKRNQIQKKLQQVQQPETPKSEKHQEYLNSEEYKQNQEKKIKQLQEQLQALEEDYKRINENRQKVQAIIEMDKQRIRALKSVQEKPFTKLQALWQLLATLWWLVVEWGTGYGVKPFRIGFVALGCILLYTGIYLIPPYEQKNVIETFFFSAFVFVTEVVDHPVAHMGGVMELAVLSEAFLGLFLMTLFVGTYTRKIIR